MGGGQRRRDQRFAGDRLAHSSSQESRRRLIDQMNRVRDRDANEARLRESEREVHDRGINNTNERSRNQSRGLNSRGLATNQPNRQVLNRDGNEASTDDESEPLSTDNDNNSGITSSQIDHAIRPYHGAPVEDSTDPSVYSVPETTEASRNIARRSHSTLDELNNRFFRTIWNETALSLSESGQSRHDAQLEILRTRFVHIMQQNPEGIQSRRDWRMAESIFDRAYVRARERWSATPMWNAVWNNDEARDRLLELHNEGIIHIRRDAETGLPTGAPRMQQYNPSNGRYPWVPINIDHAVPLERNPWGVLEPDNLVATTAHINQRTLNYLSRDTPFLMSVDRFGGSMQDLENQIENFVMSNGLSRRRRASASHLHERFGSIAEGVLLRERNRNSGNSNQAVNRGLIQALSLVLDLLLGRVQSSIYEDTVLRMREADRRRRHRRSHNQFNIVRDTALPGNLSRAFDAIVGNRHPFEVTQLGLLRRELQRHLQRWSRSRGQGWYYFNEIVNHADQAPTPLQRRELIEEQINSMNSNIRYLYSVINRINQRLREENWDEVANEWEEMANSHDSILQDDMSSFRLNPSDASYISSSGFRRIASEYRNFADQLGLMRNLCLDNISRYMDLVQSADVLLNSIR